MDILKRFKLHTADPTKQHATSLAEALTFCAYDYFIKENFIHLENSLNDDEEEVKTGMEKLKNMISEGTEPDCIEMSIFPILEFFYNDFIGWTGGGKYNYEEVRNSIGFIKSLVGQIRTTAHEFKK